MTAGTHVKKQLLLWDTFLEWRIKLQKLLVAANSLPQHENWAEISSAGEQEFQSTHRQAVHQLNRLSSALQIMNNVLLHDDCFMFAKSDSQKEDGDDDDEISSDMGSGSEHSDYDQGSADETDDHDDDAGPNDAGPSRKRKNEMPDDSGSYDQIKRIRDDVIDEWYNRTRFSTAGSRKGLESFEQPPAIQIRQIMSDEKRLLKRTQLRRSQCPIIGKAVTDNGTEKSGCKEHNYDPEIFDDDDFYHQLLRELIDSKTSESGDSLSVSRKLLEIQKLRSRMKRKVDTKASKGRKLRFETQKELMNFMAPVKTFNFTEEAKDELFSSLFQ